MSYIRGALPFLIYNPNTRDDIIPDGIRTSFELSQEVPGGYENNVQVIKREFKDESLIQNCVSIAFVGSSDSITCSVPAIAAALSTINAGESIKVSGAAQADNNGKFTVTSVTYDGQSITIVLDTSLVSESAGASVSLVRQYIGPWEVIEPIVDYTISGTGEQANKLINFTKVPREEDVLYVMHRGEATYNFVPSERSVGPEQLAENLRNFLVDTFSGNGIETDFELSQTTVNARAIEVSVNGVIKYGTDYDIDFEGDFELLEDCKTISFATAPPNGAKVYVRHLGFSTVSRRQFLSPSQIGSVGPKTIGTSNLQNNCVTEEILDDGSVSSVKIRTGSVDGTKILLQNDQSLNWKSSIAPGTPVSVLKVDTSNIATLRSPGSSLLLNIGDLRTVQLTDSAIYTPSTSGTVSLGIPANRFGNGYFLGTVFASNVDVTSNLTVGGNAEILGSVTVSGSIAVSGNVDGVDVAALQAQVTALAALVAQNSPAGTIKMWAKDADAPTGYLLCDGRSYSTATYPALFAAIQYAFGGAGSNFSGPDFRGRFPLGKAASGTGSGWGSASGRGGSLDHTHGTPSHKHSLNDHIHTVPSHYHSTGNGGDLSAIKSGADAMSGNMSANDWHSHSVTESAHTHTASDTGHTHSIPARDAAMNSYDSTLFPTYTSSNPANNRVRSTGIGYASISVSSVKTNVSVDSKNIDHKHSIPDHSHSVSGSIGNKSSGSNGDLDFNSGKASPGDTDTSGSGTTDGANPAYQTINFIIKT